MTDRATIVAEIGINHNGSLETALSLIDASAAAGCDYVKFQVRSPRICVPRDQWDKPRSTPWGDMSYIEYKEMIELSLEDYARIGEHCQQIGIGWFISPWDVPAYERMNERFSFPMWKIASASITDHRLLEAVGGYGRHIVLSTGMSTMEEVIEAVEVLGKTGAKITLCHCNSTYPCPNTELNLNCITMFQNRFLETRVVDAIGYSGHEVGLATTVAAVALGATYIERHISLDRASWGTDQSASVEPEGFRRLVRYIRAVEDAMGDGVKRITEGELEPRERLRGSSGLTKVDLEAARRHLSETNWEPDREIKVFSSADGEGKPMVFPPEGSIIDPGGVSI